MKKIVVFLLLLFLVFSCREKVSNEGINSFTSLDNSSCVGCHTDKDLLAEVAEPLEDAGGEAGEG